MTYMHCRHIYNFYYVHNTFIYTVQQLHLITTDRLMILMYLVTNIAIQVFLYQMCCLNNSDSLI